MSDFLGAELQEFDGEDASQAGKCLSSLIDTNAYVGELLSLGYDDAVVLVHDERRQKVGGLPMGCFLLASRMQPGGAADAGKEDTALVLLRVVSDAALSNRADTEKYRLAAGFRAVDTEENWDADKKTDQFTLNQLRHAGVRCIVLGTFRMKRQEELWKLFFGSDISNFYSGQGMKVYKPVGAALSAIVNYRNPAKRVHELAGEDVPVGRVRYCSSEIEISPERENVAVGLDPIDLVARRTALFGMSRSGKSNTVKIIAAAIFNLRERSKKGRIGQLIFDVDGEYCNDNPQDKGCLRNISDADVATYGLFEHPHDEGRQLLKINFLGDELNDWNDKDKVVSAMETLVIGKEIVDDALAAEGAGYIKAFRNVSLAVPDKEWTAGEVCRYRRVVQIYRALLVKSGFSCAVNSNVFVKGLFSEKFREAMSKEYAAAAETLGKEHVSWDEFYAAVFDMRQFVVASDGFKTFDKAYIKGKGKSWADETLLGVLSLLENTRGARLVGGVKDQHAPDTEGDYADRIVDDVRGGKLVIVDQSTGSPDLVNISTERIMWKLFNAQKGEFISPQMDAAGDVQPPPDVIVYAEEAHNLLPARATPDELRGVWARTAKEGSKFHIGMVFSTQEPSSILSNILKNTDNWFVAHLNNQDEIKELKKYYDFGEFGSQILKVTDTGFLRMRCLSNSYIVPVQVNVFGADAEKDAE